MSSQLNVDTIVDKAGSGGTNVKIANTSVTVAEGGSGTTSTVQGLCKGFLFYDQPAVIKSFNVSTVTDRSAGRSTTNFTNSFTDSNISIACTGQYPTGGTDGYWSCISDDNGNTANTTSSANMVQTYGRNDEEIFWDGSRQHAVYHGDLA